MKFGIGTYLFQFFEITIGHSGKDKTIKLVLRQTHQRTKDEPFAILPSHMPEFSVVKLDSVTESVRRAYGIQQPDILVHANVLQSTNLSGADAFQQLCNPFTEGPDEVLTEQAKLHIQIMLRVVVAPVNFVPSEKGPLSGQDVLLGRYNAELTEVAGWIYFIILAS